MRPLTARTTTVLNDPRRSVLAAKRLNMSESPARQPPAIEDGKPLIAYASPRDHHDGHAASAILAIVSLVFTATAWLFIAVVGTPWLLYGQDQMRLALVWGIPSATLVAIVLAIPARVMASQKVGLSTLALVGAAATALFLVASIIYVIGHMPG